MNAIHRPASTSDSRADAPIDDQKHRARTLGIRWGAVQDAATAVASIAGRGDEPMGQRARNFPVMIRNEPQWRRDLAEQAVADLAAIMQPGVKALLAVAARGQDASVPARALWQEYEAMREAILALVPVSGAMGPDRSA